MIDTEPQGDRIKGSKKKPDNIKFPPYAKKPTSPPKKQECGDEETVGEEGDATSSSSSSTTTITTTTTTKAPEVDIESESVSVTSSDNGDDEDNSSVAEAKPGKFKGISKKSF